MEATETRYRGGPGTSKQLLSEGDDSLLPTFDMGKYSKIRNGRGGRSADEPLFPKQLSLVIVTIVIVLCFGFIKYIDNKLPQPLNTADLKDHPYSFIEQRARNDLSALSGLGPRVCGSHANDVAAVELLVRQLKEIQKNKKPVHKIEIDVTKHTGQFNLDFFDGMTSSYASVPNVIARLEPAVGTRTDDSILINCHFDSVPGSPGASDDMVNCAVMLEVLRTLSQKPTALKNNIIFLFNGAEENFLQASHGFLVGKTEAGDQVARGHKWSKNIRTFVNLEACGAGGREILFQTGPGNGWLVQAYARSVPYPFGSAVGEEIFQNGLIPSDTDYRIFRDYSHIPGLDLAFIKNGYVYHTVYDEVDQIPAGSVQHVGANVLALTETLGNLDYSQIELTEDRMVFFDVFGFFMITYSEKVGIGINVAVALITLYFAWRDAEGHISQILINVGATIAAWTIGILSAVIVGVLLNLARYPMPFFSQPDFAFLIFGIPTLVGQVLAYSYILSPSEDYSWMAAKTTLSCLILAVTFVSRIVFILTINVGFGVLGWYASRQLFRDSQRRLLFYLLVGELFPLALTFYLSTVSLDVFVPIMGRSGSETNPNVIIAFLTAFTISVPGFTGLVPVFVFLKKNFLRGAALIYVGVVLTIVFGIGRIPYTPKTPMRVHIADVERQWFAPDLKTVTKSDAGYWFFTMDPSIPSFYKEWSENGIPEMERVQYLDSQNCSDLHCGRPFVFPITQLVRHTEWVPKATALPQHLKQGVQMRVTHDEFISQSRRRITFNFHGPDHLVIILSPGPKYKLVKWSLTGEIPPAKVLWNGRPTFFIYHARGINMEVLEFSCDFDRLQAQPAVAPAQSNSSAVVDITYSAFYIHGDNMKTSAFESFQRRFPDWTYVKGWTSVTNMYTID